MAKTVALSGIEKIRYAPASTIGVVTEGAWKEIKNIAMGSVTFTEGQAPKTDIMVEDKDVAFMSVFGPAEGDVLTLGVLEQNPELLQALYNVDYAAATSTMDFKAKKKIPNLAFEVTTRPALDGIKTIITIYNTTVQVSTDGALTKDGAQSKVLTATLGVYRPAAKTEDYIYSKTQVNADGTVLDSTVV